MPTSREENSFPFCWSNNSAASKFIQLRFAVTFPFYYERDFITDTDAMYLDYYR